MMAGSTSGRDQQEKRSAEVLRPADASVPGSFASDEIVEKLSRANRGGSISDLPAHMIHDFGRFSKLIWGNDRPAPIRCSSCGAVDFQTSSHAILKSPSLAFLHSVWRTKTLLLDKKGSCLPSISKLFDTTSDYKHIRQMLGEDRACAESSSDHVAARVERPEASYISGSQFFQVGKVNVQSWACVSFSCLSIKEIITVVSELRELMASGMDISPEPTLFFHATTYSHHTDIEEGLLIAREFLCEKSNAEAKLLVVLHDAEYSDGYLDDLCKGIEVYQSCCCSPKPHKGDLKNVASEIMLKVLDFKARKSSVNGSSELGKFGEHFRGEDTDGSYNNKNDTSAEETSEDKPSEKQQLHVEKSSTKKRKHADCYKLHGAELIRDEEPQDTNKDSSPSQELIWNDFIFTPSIQCTCGFHFRAPPSSAFLLSVWRTEAETKLPDKKDSCLPMIDPLKLFDTTGNYKFIGKMPAEDRACLDSSSDHAAAHSKSRNSTADNSSEGTKRPEASHISGSQVRVMSKESLAKGFATINYDNLEVRKLNVRSWACVSFSHRSVEEIFMGLSELAELMATGMDTSLEPALFINAASLGYSDMRQTMLSAHEFFCNQITTEAKLLVILHDAGYSDGSLVEFCEEYGITYQFCCSQRLNKKYLMDVASEIMFKVLSFTALNFSVDRWDELMEECASSRESYKRLFGREDTDVSHSNKIDIGNEEISEGEPSEKQQLHVEKSFSKKRKHADCEDLQEVEAKDEEPPVANKVKEGSVKTWACVCFAPLPDYRIQIFSKRLREKCVSIGMDFAWFPFLFVNKKPACSKDIEDCLWSAYDQFMTDSLQRKLDLLTVILPQDRDFHGKIEEVCTHMGVVCQYFWPISVILPKNEYLRKAAQEIRHKVVGRGQLQPFVRKAIPFLSEHTVVFGADISSERRGISLFSVVASMNWPEVSRYKHLVCCRQQIWSEKVDDVLVRDLLREFYKQTTKRPERVIFFRHEVRNLSDHIYDGEIAAVRESCVSICGGLSTKITYIVVSIDEGRNEMTNKSKNIRPGAEAGEVGHAVKFEFDVAHTVAGTAHYRVILDDNNFTPDELNTICLNLCTPHHRWAYGDMPMVAPAYFASHGDTAVRKTVLYDGCEQAWDLY